MPNTALRSTINTQCTGVKRMQGKSFSATWSHRLSIAIICQFRTLSIATAVPLRGVSPMIASSHALREAGGSRTRSGQVAQVVERSPEKAGVGGSTPSLATTFQSTYAKSSREFQSALSPHSQRVENESRCSRMIVKSLPRIRIFLSPLSVRFDPRHG